MKTAITDTLKVMFVYTVISILIMLGMNNQHSNGQIGSHR
jgi:hypothetical protein